MSYYRISIRSILILSSHLHLGLPSGLFHSGFPHQAPICTFLSPIRCHTPSPPHSIWFYHQDLVRTNHEAPRFVVFSTPFTSSLLSPNIFLRTLFSETLGLCSSLSVRHQVPPPHTHTHTHIYNRRSYTPCIL